MIMLPILVLPGAGVAQTLLCLGGCETPRMEFQSGSSCSGDDRCNGIGRWGVRGSVTEGTGTVTGKMKCGGELVAHCTASNGAPCDSLLQERGTGTASCTAEVFSGDPSYEFTCYDPFVPCWTFFVWSRGGEGSPQERLVYSCEEDVQILAEELETLA